MFVSNLCVRTRRILSQINWEEVGLIVFHGLLTFAVGIYVAGETLGNWVHRTNDFLAHHWVRLIVPPTSVETEQAQIIVEVELNLPPPLVIEDPWASPIKVELMLPLALEPLAIMFTAPLILAATQAPVALLAESQEVTQPPAPTKRRRSSAPRSPGKTVNEEVEPPTTRRPRGPKAHRKRVRRTLVA